MCVTLKNNPLMSRNYFRKNGKTLRTLVPDYHTDEAVSSLFEDKISSITTYSKKQKAYVGLLKRGNSIKNKLVSSIKGKKSRYIMAGGITTVFIMIYLSSIFIPQPIRPRTNDKYFIYSAKPLVMDQTESYINSNDSRSRKIDEVFKQYNCPLEGMGNVFVSQADEYDIPWWLVASVSFQESGCGKNTPSVDGRESYNAWGWGVFGGNVKTFDNWARGIETVSEYFSEKFYKNGVTEICDIMKVYTPPSNGSWCEGVKHFGDIIQNYKSPEIK